MNVKAVEDLAPKALAVSFRYSCLTSNERRHPDTSCNTPPTTVRVHLSFVFPLTARKSRAYKQAIGPDQLVAHYV